MSATGTAVLLKFNSLLSLENYIKSVDHSNYPMTIYFQVQFLKLKCTDNTKKHKNTSALKSDRSKKASSLKKIKGQRKRYKELRRDIIEIQSQEESIEKGNRKRKRIY